MLEVRIKEEEKHNHAYTRTHRDRIERAMRVRSGEGDNVWTDKLSIQTEIVGIYFAWSVIKIVGWLMSVNTGCLAAAADVRIESIYEGK